MRFYHETLNKKEVFLSIEVALNHKGYWQYITHHEYAYTDVLTAIRGNSELSKLDVEVDPCVLTGYKIYVRKNKC